MVNPHTQAFHLIERFHLAVYGWQGNGASYYTAHWQGIPTRCVCGRDTREEVRSADVGDSHHTLLEAVHACLDKLKAAHPELFGPEDVW